MCDELGLIRRIQCDELGLIRMIQCVMNWGGYGGEDPVCDELGRIRRGGSSV